jgi:dihydroflavonol-4-reductase
MKTAVVTGASGLLGAALVRGLLQRGVRVRALYKSNTRALEGIEVEPMKADVTEPEALERAFDGADVVYHSAAYVSIDPRDSEITRRINVGGTKHVIDACKKKKVKRLVHVSSVHALRQDPLDRPLDEERALEDSQDASPYERSKADAEREVLAAVSSGLDAVIVNPAGVIGPFDYKPTGSGRMLFDLGRGALPALLPGGHDWVDSRDVAAGAISAGEEGRTGERYILSGRWCSLTDLARTVESVIGTRAPRFVVPMPVAKMSAVFAEMQARIMNKPPLFNRQALKVLEAKNKAMSHEKAKRELGYTARPLEDTLRDVYAWAYDAGMMKRSEA